MSGLRVKKKVIARLDFDFKRCKFIRGNPKPQDCFTFHFAFYKQTIGNI